MSQFGRLVTKTASADILHRQQLADGLGSLEDIGAPVLGVVLNRLKEKQTDAYSYYDYSSNPASGTRAHSKIKKTRATSGPTPRKPKRDGLRHSPPSTEPSKTVEPEQVTVPVIRSDEDKS